MHDILSEGREIESRRQLEQIIEQIGNEKTGTPARERPLTRGTAAREKIGLNIKLVRCE